MSYRGLGTDPKVSATTDPKAATATTGADSERRDFWREMGLTAVTNLPGTIQVLRGQGGQQTTLPGSDVAPYPVAPPVEPPPDNTLLIAGLVGGVALLAIIAVASRRR